MHRNFHKDIFYFGELYNVLFIYILVFIENTRRFCHVHQSTLSAQRLLRQPLVCLHRVLHHLMFHNNHLREQPWPIIEHDDKCTSGLMSSTLARNPRSENELRKAEDAT